MNRYYIKTSLLGFMYIRIVLYTCMLHRLRQTYFDIPIHVFRFCVLTKLIFGFIFKNMDIYMFHVYQHASKCLSIIFLYLDEF